MKRFRWISITAVIMSLIFSSMVYAFTWTANKRLSNSGNGSGTPAIAADDTNIYVVWSDNSLGNYDLIFMRSIDGGATWEPEEWLTNTSGRSSDPVIAADDSNLYVVWRDNTTGNSEIYFKQSVDGGATWTADSQVSDTAGESVFPAIAVDGSNIYVIWSDNTNGNYEVYFRRSVNGGVTWKRTKKLTSNAGASGPATIAVDGSNVYVVRCDDTPGNFEIYFRRSIDGGVTWENQRRLTNDDGRSVFPAIAADGSKVYVVWEDEKPGKIQLFFKRSIDRGVAWKKTKRLIQTNGRAHDPAIAADGPNVYVVWWEDTLGNAEIFFKRSVDRGVTWTANKQITNNAGYSEFPNIAIDGSDIHLVWNGRISNNYLYYRKGILD